MSMELDNSFTVPVPPDVAWGVLLDVARIAPCMPGATVDEVDGDVVTGRIKVKLGPVSLTYRGTAKFNERDEAAHTILVEASGKETRGAGTAAATVKASLEPAEAGATLVNMHTSMNVTGRPAQFGRGVMVEVSAKLIDQFASNLAQLLSADPSGPADVSAADASGSADASGTADVPGSAAEADATATAEGVGATAEGAADADGAAEIAANASAVSGTAATANGSTANTTAGTPASASAAAPAPKPAPAPTAPPAPARQDSINVIRLVGPAILKRVLGVAAVGAAAALLGRKLRRTFRRSAKD